MDILLGIGIGLTVYGIYLRVVVRYARRLFNPMGSKPIRQQLFAKMDYDALVAFEAAVLAELKRRRGL